MSCRTTPCKECGEANNVRAIACNSCGESFRKSGRPEQTTQLDGFSVGRNGGRPRGTKGRLRESTIWWDYVSISPAQ
jgi:hypothetical protein